MVRDTLGPLPKIVVVVFVPQPFLLCFFPHFFSFAFFPNHHQFLFFTIITNSQQQCEKNQDNVHKKKYVYIYEIKNMNILNSLRCASEGGFFDTHFVG